MRGMTTQWMMCGVCEVMIKNILQLFPNLKDKLKRLPITMKTMAMCIKISVIVNIKKK